MTASRPRPRPVERAGLAVDPRDPGTQESLHTRHASAGHSPGLLLWQVTNRWQAAQRAALKPFGLTHVQFVLLASLTYLGVGGPVSQRRLAEHAATDPMMTSQVIRALEDRELVRRDVDPADARARAVSVTEVGAALANRAIGAVEDCDELFFAPLAARLGDFTGDLRRLADRNMPG